MTNIINVTVTDTETLLAAYVAASKPDACVLAILADGSEPGSVTRQLLTELQENADGPVTKSLLDQLEEITLLEVDAAFGKSIIATKEYADWFHMTLFDHGAPVMSTEP